MIKTIIIWMFIKFILFGIILCLQVEDYSITETDKALTNNACFTEQKTQPCTNTWTRNPVYTEESSPRSDFSQQQMIDIVDDIIVTNNVWRGLFRRRDVTMGHNELLNFEMEFVCLNVLSIHIYLNNTKKIFSQQKMNVMEKSPYNVTFATEPMFGVDLKNATTDEIIFGIKLPRLFSYQLIQLHPHIKAQHSSEMTRYSAFQIGLLRRTSTKITQSSKQYSRTEETNGEKLYNYTDGTVIHGVHINPRYDYIHGGYILPLYDCCNRSDARNMFGLTITLDNNGRAEGEIQIRKRNSSQNEETDTYIHAKLQVTEGNCLNMKIIQTDGPDEPIYLDVIHFYGLYGYPDSFVIDKGKKYKIEENLTGKRRITNKSRIITFSDLRLDVNKDHTLRWGYF